MSHSDRNGTKRKENEEKYRHTAVFDSNFGHISVLKIVFESLESTTVRAVILCPAASIRDVMNKTGMCETNVKYATILPFFSHLLVQNEPIWLRPEKLKFEAKNNNKKPNNNPKTNKPVILLYTCL